MLFFQYEIGAFRKACDYDSNQHAMQLVRVAKIVRREMC